MITKPELLAPAGNLEKARIAFDYGADAVYVGGNVFGLRKYADNFSLDELKELTALAKLKNKKVYITLNAFAHNQDIEPLIAYLKQLNNIAIDAAIVSDVGVAKLLQEYTSIDLHVSTQASVTNVHGCLFWKNLGAKRIVLAREVSIAECVEIKTQCDVELEVFIHGAMCASYSGKCVISNYAAGRDSNRGGCVQSCRHNYEIINPSTQEVEGSTHIMNAKDLMSIDQLNEIVLAGIESLKIEGRMKSNLYVANAVSAYRSAIDYCYDSIQQKTQIKQAVLGKFKNQLSMVSNRTFSSGGLQDRPGENSINYAFSAYEKSIQYIGAVRMKDDNGYMVCDVKSGFKLSDSLMMLCPNSELKTLVNVQFRDALGNTTDHAKPNSIIRIKVPGLDINKGLLVKQLVS
jgi:U32 family peptidase